MNDARYLLAPDAALRLYETLLSPDEQVMMNLFSAILRAPEALAWSDGRQFLICRSDPGSPVWAWLRPGADGDAQQLFACVLSGRLAAGETVQLNVPSALGPLAALAAELAGRSVRAHMALRAYVCRRVREPDYHGSLSAPTDADRPAMAALLRYLVEDGDHSSIPQHEAERFAASCVGSPNLFLWRDGGAVCAMAMVAGRTERAARINTVVTDRALRGRGYAGMLVAQLCAQLLARGAEPMLYADAANPSSCRAYEKIGFTCVGTVTEYRAAP